MRIGFVGLGIMGKPMAKNLLKAGYQLSFYARKQSVIDEMKTCGATFIESIKKLTLETDVIITMLPDSPDVEDVVLGKDGIIDGISPNKIIIDMSSISPVTSKKISTILEDVGAYMLDAPVSGGEIGAIKGILAIMVGGPEDQYNKVKPILEVMGTPTRVGEIGCGNTVKLMNQIIVANNIAAMSEAYAFGLKAGMSPEVAYEAIKGGLAGSRVLDTKIDNIINKDFSPGFKVDLHIKDLYNALDTGKEIKGQLFLTSQVLEMFKVLSDKGYGGEDHSSLFRYYNEIL